MTKDFKILKPRMPTDEEHREISLRWLERIRPTLIDQWPDDVMDLSMGTQFVRVPDGLVEELFALHDGAEPGPVMNDLAAELDREMGWDRWFVRLNSRSPKDWPWPFEVPATMSGKEALNMMGASMRILDDLYEFKWVPEQPAFVCLREWVHWIRPALEFRCFVKDGELIAVTHYDYRKSTPKAIIDGAAEYRDAINTYFTEILRPRLHIDTVVFDIAMSPVGGRMLENPLLIELNPYGLSDPCWFDGYEAVENASSYIETGISDAFRDLQGRIARSWASIDGKVEHFDAEKAKPDQRNPDREDYTGHYEGYMAEAAELMKRANINA